MKKMVDFDHIEYLKSGNERQKTAYSLLIKLDVFNCLKQYHPLLVGTIPIGIDLPKSDLDIICHCENHNAFEHHLIANFSKYAEFKIGSNMHNGVQSTVARFLFKEQAIEIFGQDIPTHKQNAFRHMLIENNVLQENGEFFRKKLIKLKERGLKTEPAFAELLGLKGDPYQELLKWDDKLQIREIKPAEHQFLNVMLYQAIFVADKNTVLPREIIEQSHLKKYIQNFGQKGDYCLVSELYSKLVGAIWVRFIKGYGFVDCETPELSMAVLEEHRGIGIGTRLLTAMIYNLKRFNYSQISLSVDRENYAYQFYKKHGFNDYVVSDKSIIMARELL